MHSRYGGILRCHWETRRFQMLLYGLFCHLSSLLSRDGPSHFDRHRTHRAPGSHLSHRSIIEGPIFFSKFLLGLCEVHREPQFLVVSPRGGLVVMVGILQ